MTESFFNTKFDTITSILHGGGGGGGGGSFSDNYY